MNIITVIPLKKGFWKESLTYFSAKDIPNGSIVAITLRNKKILGLVISTEDAVASKSNIKNMSFNLKKISEVKKTSIFSKEYLDTAIETSKYFAENKNNGITALVPAVFRENYDKISKFKNTNSTLALPLSKGGVQSEKILFQASFEDRISTYKTLIRGSFAEKKISLCGIPY